MCNFYETGRRPASSQDLVSLPPRPTKPICSYREVVGVHRRSAKYLEEL